MSIQTGKDGKPASSADEDLELTRIIIMMHQENYMSQSFSVSASEPVAATASTHVGGIPAPSNDAISPTVDSNRSKSPIRWMMLAAVGTTAALWRPRILASRVSGFLLRNKVFLK
jgi:hypothetical protein